ncbi:MAG: M16 family metallopeptidase [Candidatus Sumerlaeaceae bacterium]
MSATAAQSPVFQTLSNGMRLLVLPSDANSIVSAVLFMPFPGAIEQPHEAGLVSFTHRMLMRGTRLRSNAELAEAIEALGTTMASECSDDFSYTHLVSTADSFSESVQLMAEILQQPSFEPEEIEKERQSTLAAIRRSDDDKFSATIKAFLRELYGEHGYGLPTLGYTGTVGELTREQILNVHDEFSDPAMCTAIVVGNVTPGQAERLLEEHFAKRSADPESARKDWSVQEPLYRIACRTKLTRECEQSYLVMGFPACPITHEDFPAVRVLNAVLGDGMSSRLFLRLRDEQGLAYAIGSSFSALKRGGHLFGYIGTKPESLEVARDGMQQQFDLVKSDLVPADELERTRNYLIGKFLIDHQTNYKRAFYLGYFDAMGVGIERDNLYPEIIAGVTPQQVREVANKYLTSATVAELVPVQSK